MLVEWRAISVYFIIVWILYLNKGLFWKKINLLVYIFLVFDIKFKRILFNNWDRCLEVEKGWTVIFILIVRKIIFKIFLCEIKLLIFDFFDCYLLIMWLIVVNVVSVIFIFFFMRAILFGDFTIRSDWTKRL